jgi:hypothetical protein
MRSTMRGVIGVLVLAAVGLLATNCSDSDLQSGTEGLAVKYTPSPSGAGRFERGSFGLASLKILPDDPATAAIYGSTQLSVFFDPFAADLTATTPQTFSQVALAAGNYRVTEFKVTSPTMVDENVSPTPATCIDGVVAVPSGPAAAQVPNTITFLNPPTLAFTVHPGQTSFSITVDVPRLVSEYQAEFTCLADCGGGQPCLIGFDETAYRNTMLAVISIQ